MLFLLTELGLSDKGDELRKLLKTQLEEATGQRCFVFPDFVKTIIHVPETKDAAPLDEAAP